MTDRQNVAAACSRGSFFKSPRNGPTWRAAVANIQSGDPLRRRCPRHARKVDLKSARRPHRSDGRVVAARACRQTRSPVPLRSAKTIGAVPGSAYKRPGWLPLLFIPNKRPGGTHMSIDGSREKRWFEMDCSLDERVLGELVSVGRIPCLTGKEQGFYGSKATGEPKRLPTHKAFSENSLVKEQGISSTKQGIKSGEEGFARTDSWNPEASQCSRSQPLSGGRSESGEIGKASAAAYL
jgi:hypothetical protein